jgi:hypothetical protein
MRMPSHIRQRDNTARPVKMLEMVIVVIMNLCMNQGGLRIAGGCLTNLGEPADGLVSPSDGRELDFNCIIDI